MTTADCFVTYVSARPACPSRIGTLRTQDANRHMHAPSTIELRRPFLRLSRNAASGTAQQYAIGPSSRNMSSVVALVSQLLALPFAQRKWLEGSGTEDLSIGKI